MEPLQTKSYASGQEAITVYLNSEDVANLRRLVAILGVNENDVIRKAISDELFIRTNLAEGSKLVLARGKDLREINF